ncbi:UPF0182 family protein [Nocardioides mangrovicus]|uniref:UPF0182 protein D9V37_02905 n=2 Tax=Nocardioides mangrovicus TaxID=2478913 RepID=A0A3L8P7D2_9ACTN|nr:UPF0182 family protein [Nocardioides mangrovicus]
MTALVLVVLFLLLSLFTSIWTQKLWFQSIGFGSVYGRLLATRIGLFVVFGLVMALVVGVNLFLAFRFRPLFRPNTPDQANLERYREVVTPLRRALLVAVAAVLGIFAGISATGQWRTYLLWRHRQFFGQEDPYFHRDIGFYFFSLPWFHYLVDFLTTALVIGLMAAVLVHYLYGGIRLTGGQRFTGAAQVQTSVLLGLLLLLKSGDYYLDRFDLTTNQGSLITGMTYARDHAVLPSKNILMFIALICALLLFANVFRRTWLLPGVGIALLALSSILLGVIWPTVVQKLQVNPSVADKEAPYIQRNITATRAAYDVGDSKVTQYDASSTLTNDKLAEDTASLPGIRLVDPQVVRPTFEQLQQIRGYYSVPNVLDVDRYDVNDRERDVVVAARELNINGLPDAQKNWTNEHTVYTHGYGMIAAYGNQQNADDKPVTDNQGNPVFAEYDLPPKGQLGKYVPQIYYGEQSPTYSIVGKPEGTKSVELDTPDANGSGNSRTNTYDGPGVSIGSTFHKLLYAMKFGDTNILLSSRVNSASKILYDRSPRERVQKVAPWLTVDSDALPSVVNGRIVWILDGYTTSDKYPLSESRSLKEMVDDRLNPRSAFATLPTDHINYMRNAVKATVDAYTGKVTLYAWDESDPLLKAWEGVFPGVVKPKSSIPQALLAHMRYPEDLYKVQRNILADYHVTNPRTFYGGSDKWEVPQDPEVDSLKQPPYRLSVAASSSEKAQPVFSLTSVYVPTKRQNLAAFMSVGSDPTDPSTYGKISLLRLPDDKQIAGPSQIANQFSSNDSIAAQLLPFTQQKAVLRYGNLLTLPVGGGLLYVQPLYTLRTGGGASYPQLRFVLVSFGKNVGIGATLDEALNSVLGGSSGSGTSGTSGTSGSSGSTGSGTTGTLNGQALALLQQANAKFTDAQKALKAGDPVTYAQDIEAARKLIEQAVAASKKTASSSPSASPSASASASPSAKPSS